MSGKKLTVSFLLLYCVLANPIQAPTKLMRHSLPITLGRKWEKKKQIRSTRSINKKESPITSLHNIPKDSIVSWLKSEAKASPISVESLRAQEQILDIFTKSPSPLKLIKKICRAFGPSVHTPFTQILNATFTEAPQKILKYSPCAYEKILSLSNYKKISMGATSAVVAHLQGAPAHDKCSIKLRKRLVEILQTHYSPTVVDGAFALIERRKKAPNTTKEFLEILKAPELYALYPAALIQDLAMHVLQRGKDDEIFELMSLNLAAHETNWVGFAITTTYFFAIDNSYGRYQGVVPPFSNDPRVAESDEGNKYGPKLITLRNHNWGLIDLGSFISATGADMMNTIVENERWKRFHYQRNMEKEMGMITFLTLEGDYNSINLGTATPEVVEVFCKEVTHLLGDAEFWNLKFRRKIMIKDAMLGVCPENEEEMKTAKYKLRLSAHSGEELECSVFELTQRLPEFSWYVSRKKLPLAAFKKLFECGFTIESLVEMSKYTFIDLSINKNLALAIKEHYLPIFDIMDQNNSPFPSITAFLIRNLS